MSVRMSERRVSWHGAHSSTERFLEWSSDISLSIHPAVHIIVLFAGVRGEVGDQRGGGAGAGGQVQLPELHLARVPDC